MLLQFQALRRKRKRCSASSCPNGNVFLIRRLIEGLDELEERDLELEQLWIEEAVRRLELYRQGKIGSRPAPEVFADARDRLREMQ